MDYHHCHRNKTTAKRPIAMLPLRRDMLLEVALQLRDLIKVAHAEDDQRLGSASQHVEGATDEHTGTS